MPNTGESIAKEVSGKKGGLKEITKELEDQLKLLRAGEELTAQSFGQEDQQERGKYRSFTVTTRIVNNLISGEIANALRKVYGDALEPEPVEVGENGTAIMRMKNPSLTKEQLNDALQRSMAKLALEKEFTDIKDEVVNLKVSAVTPKNDYLEAQISGYMPAAQAKPGLDGKVASANTGHLMRIKQALEAGALSPDHSLDRLEGSISRTNAFGAQVASDSFWLSVVPLVVASLAVFVYLWFRFEFSGAWGFGAIVALIHNVVIAVGAVTIAHIIGFPILFNLNIIAALITITGFSVNDTIVVFDRIREVKAAHPTRSYEDIVNEACNATLSRTILTSLTVLLSVISLLVLGGPTIKDMAFTLLVGFTVGTYSSIFIASPLMIWWYKRYGTGRAPVPSMVKKQTEPEYAKGAQV